MPIGTTVYVILAGIHRVTANVRIRKGQSGWVCRVSGGMWMCVHDPDGIECNGEEMSCKEKRGWCDPVRLRGVGVERARS